MTDRRRLADDLVRILDAEPSGLPCVDLAARLHRRRGTLVAVMRDDPRFVQDGSTRGSRWRVVAGSGLGPNGTGPGSNDLLCSALDPSGIPTIGTTELDAS